MRKQRKGKKFGRVSSQRKALIKSLISSLITHGKITTTEIKAKALRPKVEKLVTHARVGTVSKTRLIRKLISEKDSMKLIKEIAPRYKDRAGGYTRIYKLPPRKSDAAKMAIIEFI